MEDPIRTPSDTERLERKLDALTELTSELIATQRRQADFFHEFAPIVKEMQRWAGSQLDELEQAGWFAFGREALGILEHVVEAYEPEDARQLREGVVTILDGLRAVTQPEVMELVSEAGEALQHGDELSPVTPFEVLRAGRDPEVQQGLAVMMEVLRQVGRASRNALPDEARDRARRRRKLDRRTGPRERKARTSNVVPLQVAPVSTATPAPPPLVLEGWTLDDTGFLAEPASWNPGFAEQMAAVLGVNELTDKHWAVVEFARTVWEETGTSPNIRRITLGSGVDTKELYALWPSAPGKTTARVAGIPKPAGCL